VPGGAVPKRGSQARFGLDGERRLVRKADFERLLRDGVKRKRAGFLFILAERDSGAPRLGILISRKHAAKATVRNQIKRCIREAFRLEQERLGAIDLLVRPPYGVRPGPAMLLRLRELLGAVRR
jgi:ribonuclease P protein component